MTSYLPHVNACLNGIATFLLVVGYVLIRQRRERAHRNVMLSCFAVSVLFLLSYSVYHTQAGRVHFPDYPAASIRTAYRLILFSHMILAAIVPILALTTIYLGLSGRRLAHRRIARWTFPIWLYVSITGVLVYLMLYQLYPPISHGVTMSQVDREFIGTTLASGPELRTPCNPFVASL